MAIVLPAVDSFNGRAKINIFGYVLHKNDLRVQRCQNEFQKSQGFNQAGKISTFSNIQPSRGSLQRFLKLDRVGAHFNILQGFIESGLTSARIQRNQGSPGSNRVGADNNALHDVKKGDSHFGSQPSRDSLQRFLKLDRVGAHFNILQGFIEAGLTSAFSAIQRNQGSPGSNRVGADNNALHDVKKGDSHFGSQPSSD
jgi:hypothetical protein